MIIGYKDFLYNENLADDTIEMSIQFSMHIDQEEWYVASWLQKRDYAIVRIYSDSRAKRLDWYRYRLTNHIKDDEIIEEQHFHVYSDIRPDLQLLKRVCEMFAREKYIIQKGIVPDITYEKKWLLTGSFIVPEKKVIMYVDGNTLYIKALCKADINKNKFRPAIPFGDNGEMEVSNNEFKPMIYIKGKDDGIDIDKNKFLTLAIFGYNGEIEISDNQFKPMIKIGDGKGISPNGNWQFTIESLILIGYPEYTMSNKYKSTYITMDKVEDGITHMYAVKNSLNNVFALCENLTKIQDIENTNYVKNMNQTFVDCCKLSSIPLFDTSNVTSMQGTFSATESLQTIPLFDTSNVTTMESMFDYGLYITRTAYTKERVSAIKTIPKLNTSKVTNMKNMFNCCKYLTSIPQIDTSNVTTMESMFGGTVSLKNIPLLNTSKVTNMKYMFQYKYLKEISAGSAPSYIWSEKYSEILFPAIETIPKLDTSNVTSMERMFEGCTHLTSMPQIDTSKVTDMTAMFCGCESLTTIPKLNTSKVKSMNNMFGPLYNMINNKDIRCSSLTSIPDIDASSCYNMANMFLWCNNLKTISSITNSKYVNTMHGMFWCCESLLSVPSLDTSNVTDMYGMFMGCWKIKTIPQFDTSNVTDMSNMFTYCISLQTVPYMDTSKVKSFSDICITPSNTWEINGMFYGDYSLTSIPWEIDMSSIPTGTVTKYTDTSTFTFTPYENMFYGCSSLSNVKLKNVPPDFDVSKLGISSSKVTIISKRSS